MPRLALVAAFVVSPAILLAACSTKTSPTSPAPLGSASSATPPRPPPGKAPSDASTSLAETTPPPAVSAEPPPLPPIEVATATPRKPSGKKAKLAWGQGLCDNTGLYDTGRYAEAELLATLDLFQKAYVPFVNDQTTRASLDAAFKASFEATRTLKIVAEQPWEVYRAAVLTQTRQRYLLAVSELAYRSDRQALRAHPSFAVCQRWAEPLMTDDEATVLAGWRALASELGAKPGASHMWAEVDAASKRPDAVPRARKELLTFGWHNCVNDLVVPLPFDSRDFEKLLTNVKHDCEH